MSFITDPEDYCNRVQIDGDSAKSIKPTIMMTSHQISLFYDDKPDALYQSVDFAHITSVEHIQGAPECVYMHNSEGKVIMPCLGTVLLKRDFLKAFKMFEMCNAGINISTLDCFDWDETVISPKM